MLGEFVKGEFVNEEFVKKKFVKGRKIRQKAEKHGKFVKKFCFLKSASKAEDSSKKFVFKKILNNRFFYTLKSTMFLQSGILLPGTFLNANGYLQPKIIEW